jgi:hypothetical protein
MGADITRRIATGALAAAVCVLTATAGLVPVAMAGQFRPGTGVPVVIVGGGVLLWLWRPGRRVRADRSAPVWFVPAAVGVALLVTLPSARDANEHVVVDRDPGIYMSTAAWLRSEGDLVIDEPTGPFSDEPGLVERTTAQPLLAGGDRGFQGLHLLPAQAAALGWIGGDDLMARTSVVLAATGLVLLMAFARRVVGPVWALIAGGTLGVTLPFAYLSRDLFSEWSLFALVAGGLWALDSALAERSVRRAVVAGAAFGAATMARIDSPVAVGGLALALGWWWLSADREVSDERSQRARVLAAVAVPILVGGQVGVADGWLRSRGYVRAHRAEVIAQLALPLAGVALVAAVVLLARRTTWRPKNRWWATRAGAGALAGTLVALAFFAVVVRPAFPSGAEMEPSAITAGLQRAEGEAIDPTRTYAELSGRWMAWYLGLGTVVAAVAGGAVLLYEWARGRRVRAEGLLAAVVVPPLVLFLARPSIYPDHPWASRRFLPTVLPGLVLAAAWFGHWLWRMKLAPRWRRWATRAGAVVVAVAMVGYPLAVLRPLVRMRQHTDNVGMVRELCAAIPADAAILVVRMPAEAWVPALTTFCDRPVAGVVDPGGPTPDTIERLAEEWRNAGRSLWLVGPAGSVLTPLGARPTVAAARHDDLVLRWSLTERPRKTRDGRVALVAGPVAP